MSSVERRVQAIKRQVTIDEVLEHFGLDYARLDISREWLPAVCPFHDDRNASASVNLERDYFVCHGCGIRGDVIDVVMQSENLDFRAALEYLEEEFDVG